MTAKLGSASSYLGDLLSKHMPRGKIVEEYRSEKLHPELPANFAILTRKFASPKGVPADEFAQVGYSQQLTLHDAAGRRLLVHARWEPREPREGPPPPGTSVLEKARRRQYTIYDVMEYTNGRFTDRATAPNDY